MLRSEFVFSRSPTRTNPPFSVGSPPEEPDILEFLDTTGYAFLGSVSLTISTYKTAFCESSNVTLPAAELETTLSEFVYQHFSAYFEHMQTRYHVF